MTELIHDSIPSKGAKNVLKRAGQLAQLCWTPVMPFPAILADSRTGSKLPVYLPAWRPQTGLNYSAARFDEKYVGSNVVDVKITIEAN